MSVNKLIGLKNSGTIKDNYYVPIHTVTVTHINFNDSEVAIVISNWNQLLGKKKNRVKLLIVCTVLLILTERAYSLLTS